MNSDLLQRISIAERAFRQLGAATTLRYAVYQLGLRTGRWKRRTSTRSPVENPRIAARLERVATGGLRPVLVTPNAEILRLVLQENEELLVQQAAEIAGGQFRRYGASPVSLDLAPHTPLVHWSQAQGLAEGDIKDIWEPARLGWAFVLGRAFVSTGNPDHCHTFWDLFRSFRRLNPYNCGANWVSGQEVALRILALAFAAQVFYDSPHTTADDRLALVQSLYEHATRIPPTLVYARAQRNNHLVTEALGLYTAGWVLQGAPGAEGWLEDGHALLNEALEDQIAKDGTYIQHSMNYHRLMLHAALWGHALNRRCGLTYTPTVKEKLAAATYWLLAQVDPTSGRAPNLGANDGALILPLCTCEYEDYRPVAEAAALAFTGRGLEASGCWDECSLWLGLPLNQQGGQRQKYDSPGVLRLGDNYSWATLRAAPYSYRPAQADQLHVDLWWQGENVALDAGTYRYNAPPPWENALAATAVHNTVQIDGYDQMERAGRFLWLDWAQPNIIFRGRVNYEKVSAEHDGYTFLHVVHRRTLSRLSTDHWMIEDLIEATKPARSRRQIRLHWLTPDWPFQVVNESITLRSPKVNMMIGVTAFSHENSRIPLEQLQIFRAGQGVYGAQENNTHMGYISPTYSVLQPALSIVVNLLEKLPVRIITTWSFLPVDHR